MLRTAVLAFVPAAGLLALAAGATFAQPQLIHREMLQSRDAPTPPWRTGTPHSVQNAGPGELTILSTYVVDRAKPLATPAP